MPVPSVKPEFGVRLVVLVRLQADEGEAQEEGQGEEDLQARAVAGDQRVVRDGHGHAAREQDRRVDSGQAERRDGLERAVGARPDGRRAVGRPRRRS